MIKRISKKQEWYLNIIINQLGLIMEEPYSYENAYSFISENIKHIDIKKGYTEYKSYRKYYNFPTEKQWYLIQQIENKTEVKFEGNNFEEANKYIKKYKDCKRHDFEEKRRSLEVERYEGAYSASGISYSNSGDFEGNYNQYTGIMSNDSMYIEDMLNKAIFWSGGVGVLSDDGRSYL